MMGGLAFLFATACDKHPPFRDPGLSHTWYFAGPVRIRNGQGGFPNLPSGDSHEQTDRHQSPFSFDPTLLAEPASLWPSRGGLRDENPLSL